MSMFQWRTLRRFTANLPQSHLSTSFRHQHSNSKSTSSWKWTPIPVSVGLALIALQHYGNIQEREQRQLRQLKTMSQDPEAMVVDHWHIALLKTLPFRSISRWWGHINSAYELPMFLRAPIYLLWTWAFDCKLEEMEAQDLTSFRNLNAFFTRRLKEGVRPIDGQAPVVSPADARVLHFGPVTQKSLEQVKGVTYSMDSFLGCGQHSWDPSEKYHDIPYDTKNNQLYHCVLYLAPGDYHRFHSPVPWSVEKLKHFAGRLFSVSPGMVKVLQGLFVQNERIVMLGQWKHGFFSMTAVGATNVGSIQLSFDDSFRTNQRIREPDGTYTEKCMITQQVSKKAKRTKQADPPLLPSGLEIGKGAELGQFNLGSTVVLVFEAPKDFTFCVQAEQKVKVGQPLGYIHDTDPSHMHVKESHPGNRSLEQVVADGMRERRGYV